MNRLLERAEVYVGGKWLPGGGPPLRTVSPVTEQVNGGCVSADRDGIDAAVTAARQLIDTAPWPGLRPSQRVGHLVALQEAYTASRWTMHRLVCWQTGALSHADQAREPLDIIAAMTCSPDPPRMPIFRAGHQAARAPVGVVVAVTSWDTPQKAIMARVAPALLAGCAVIVVPSAHTPLDALYLADLAEGIGLPSGALSVLPLYGHPSLLPYLLTHPGVDLVSFTGSASTGARIARLCAAVSRPVRLHCGGRSAAVITADADLQAAVAALRTLALGNGGQTRAAVARLVAHESVATELSERVRAMMRGLKVGDPTLPDTDVGPLVSAAQKSQVLDYVRAAHQRGLPMLTGVGVPEGPGWYVYPTLFGEVPPGVLTGQHDLLGPVLSVHTYRDDEQAVTLANGTGPGRALAAAVFSGTPGTALAMAGRLAAHTVHLNGAQALAHPWGELDPDGYCHLTLIAG